MALNKEAKALAAELEQAVAGDGEPSNQLVARMIGHAMRCLAVIADALDRAHPANPLKTESDDGPR